MPASTISAMLPRLGLRTVGSKYQMIGSASTTTSAVNSTMMATFESLKKRSTRYLSKCTEMAHRTGPENAKKSQDIPDSLYLSTTARDAQRSAAIGATPDS